MSDVTGAPASPSAAGSSPAPSTAVPETSAPAVSSPAPASGAPATPESSTAAPSTDPGPIPYARFKEVNDQLAALRWARDVDPAAVREAERIGRLYQTDRVGYLRSVLAEALLDAELAPQIRSLAGHTLAGGRSQPDAPIEPDIPVYDANGQLVSQTFSAERVQQIVQRAIKDAIGNEVAPIKKTFAEQQAQAKAQAEQQQVMQRSDAIYQRAVAKYPHFKEHEAEIAQAMAHYPDADASEAIALAWADVVLPKLDQKSQTKLLGHLQTQAAGASVAPNASMSTAPPKFKTFKEAAEYYEKHPEHAEAMAQR